MRFPLRSESHINLRTHCVILTQRTWRPIPQLFASFLDFRRNWYFSKKYFQNTFLNIFRIKKRKLYLWRTNTNLIVLLISIFPLTLWITSENRTKLKNLLSWTTKSDGIQHYKHTNPSNDVSNILNWTWFLISGCRNSFNSKLKNLWTRKNFFNPANTQTSSEESLKKKFLTFIGMRSLFI